MRRAAGSASIDRQHTTRFADIFRGRMLRFTIAVTFMNACTLFGWWGLNGWIPAYLSLPVAQGGIGLTPRTMSWFVVAMQIGMWIGYVAFGFISDTVGRKRVYVTFLILASVLLPLYGATHSPMVLLLLGPFVACFGTGFFSGFGAVTAEIYPTSVRATAQGFTYNLGRIASAAAPFTVGHGGDLTWIQRGVRDRGCGVSAGRAHVDLDSGDAIGFPLEPSVAKYSRTASASPSAAIKPTYPSGRTSTNAPPSASYD